MSIAQREVLTDRDNDRSRICESHVLHENKVFDHSLSDVLRTSLLTRLDLLLSKPLATDRLCSGVLPLSGRFQGNSFRFYKAEWLAFGARITSPHQLFLHLGIPCVNIAHIIQLCKMVFVRINRIPSNRCCKRLTIHICKVPLRYMVNSGYFKGEKDRIKINHANLS